MQSVNIFFLNTFRIFVFSLVFFQCKNAANNTKQSSDEIIFSLETTACNGTCPVYKFQLYKSGDISYQGITYVDNLGKFEAKLNTTSINELFSTVNKIKFYDLKLKNDSTVLDLPSTHIFAKTVDRQNRILYYYPKNEAIDQLIGLIVQYIERADWKKTN